MPELTGEIAQQYVPSLPTESTKKTVTPQPQTSSSGGVFDRLKGAFGGKQEGPATQPNERTRQPESPKGTVDQRAQVLFQLLLDKVELQVAIHRRAETIANTTTFPEGEIAREVGLLRQNPQYKDVPNEQITDIANSRLRRNKIKELKTFDHDPLALEPNDGTVTSTDKKVDLKNLSPEDIASGRISMAELTGQLTLATSSTPKTAESKTDGLIQESHLQLTAVNRQINELMQDPAVVEHYQTLKEERVNLLRQVREAAYGKKLIHDIELAQERMARTIYIEKRRFTPAEETVIQRNQLIAKAIERRVNDIVAQPEVFSMMRWRELREYQKGLKRDRFAETPSRADLVNKVRHLWAEGRRVLATGPTGSGKTELFFHASRSMFGVSPEKVTGHPNLSGFEVYGRPMGNGFEPGPLTRAIDTDVPFIYDEINAVEDNRTNMRLKTDMNARMGQEISVQEEGNGHRHAIGERFSWNATANVKSEKHPDRVKLDPALVRMFDALPVGYLPRHELYDMMLASIMDMRGGIQLASKDDLNAMAELCQASEWVQRAYQGYDVDLGGGEKLYSRGGESTKKVATLREAVLDPGKALDMMAGWDDARMRGLTLREHLNNKIVGFITNENFPEEDRYHLVRIFALNEFLRGVKVEDLGIGGLDQATLDQWNGYSGRKIKAGDVYLTSEQVAAQDPFGVVNRPDGSAAADLLGEDETIEEVEEDINTQPARFTTTPASSETKRTTASHVDTAGRILLDVVDATFPTTSLPSDYETRYSGYPDQLNKIVAKNVTTFQEVLNRYNLILDGVTPDHIDLGNYLQRLKICVKTMKESGQPIPTEAAQLLSKVAKFIPGSRDDGRVQRGIDQIMDLLF